MLAVAPRIRGSVTGLVKQAMREREQGRLVLVVPEAVAEA